MSETLEHLLDQCVSKLGEEAVEKALQLLVADESGPDASQVLTIVANAGVHTIPESYLRGEVYVASRGNWRVDNDETLNSHVSQILTGVARKLKERQWRRIYLIPTGHPAVSMNIKLLVYRAIRLNTIDWVYINGEYYLLTIDQREISIGADDTE